MKDAKYVKGAVGLVAMRIAGVHLAKLRFGAGGETSGYWLGKRLWTVSGILKVAPASGIGAGRNEFRDP